MKILTMKSDISTLKRDVEHVLKTGEGWTKEIEEWVCDDIQQSFQNQLVNQMNAEPERKLRFSNMGSKCDAYIWYLKNSKTEDVSLPPNLKALFTYGDMVESFLLGLCMASGHSVEGLQTTMTINGVEGHRDAVIDGMTVDIKSASEYNFTKFEQGLTIDKDTYGYLDQLSSYVYAGKDDPLVINKTHGAFVAFNKSNGKLVVDVHDFTPWLETKEYEVNRKIKITKLSEVPKRGYEPVKLGKSGNTMLCSTCSMCNFREECWPEVRAFAYGNGVKYLVNVVKEPRVMELTN